MRLKIGATGDVYLQGLHPNMGRYFLYRAFLSGQATLIPSLLMIYQDCGLKVSDILKLEAIFAAVLAFLTVAGGHFADRLSRRSAMLVGVGVLAVGILAYAGAHSFSELVCAELIYALGLALHLGAEHALVYDSLLERGAEQHHPDVRERGVMVGYLGSALFAVLSGVTAAYAGGRVAAATGAVFLIASLPNIWLMTEPNIGRGGKRKSNLAVIRMVADKAIFKNTEIRWLLPYAGFVSTLACIGGPIFQSYYIECGIDKSWFFGITTLLNIFGALCLKYSKTVESRLASQSIGLCVIGVLGTLYLVLGSCAWWGALVFVFPIFWTRGFLDILFVDKLNKLVESESRATMNSLLGFTTKITYATLLYLLAITSGQENASKALLSIGALTLAFGTCSYLFRRKKS